MIKIRHIEPDEIAAAKQLIYRVAHEVFQDTRPLEESIAFYEARGQLHDMDELQQTYFDDSGIFLVLTEDDQIIGTGAIRKIDDQTCELKRLWLLFEYHGQGLGYRMIQELFSFARGKGYRRMRLETDQTAQSRAFELYKRLGFYEIPRYSDNEDDVAMEMVL
ncbi:MAG TPA: GNAT family N-acetyltransferase [Anaerolineales bacterium]|nr:GNAT family N-acetyltransferase [Anaerolineales bacterium]